MKGNVCVLHLFSAYVWLSFVLFMKTNSLHPPLSIATLQCHHTNLSCHC